MASKVARQERVWERGTRSSSVEEKTSNRKGNDQRTIELGCIFFRFNKCTSHECGSFCSSHLWFTVIVERKSCILDTKNGFSSSSFLPAAYFASPNLSERTLNQVQTTRRKERLFSVGQQQLLLPIPHYPVARTLRTFLSIHTSSFSRAIPLTLWRFAPRV